jgi:hypothetical protein
VDAAAVLAVGAAVTALVQFLKASPLPTGGWIPVALAFGLSAVGVALWAVSFAPGWDRVLVWSYFTGWLAVTGTAVGAYHLAKGPLNTALPAA